MACLSVAGVDSSRFHDGTWNRTQAYFASPISLHGSILFRAGTDAVDLFCQIPVPPSWIDAVFSAGLKLFDKSYFAVVTRLCLRTFVGISQTDADYRAVAFAESKSGNSFRRVDEEPYRTSQTDRADSQ